MREPLIEVGTTIFGVIVGFIFGVRLTARRYQQVLHAYLHGTTPR